MNIADFTRMAAGVWSARYQTSGGAFSTNGLSFTVTGEDPWLVGPVQTFPAASADARRVVFTVTTAPTDCSDSWQLFYAFKGKGFNEGDSCRLVPVGRPPFTRFTAKIPVSSVAAGDCRFRLDPPGGTATFTVKSLTAEFVIPRWTYTPATPPALALPETTPYALKGRNWELRHDPKRFGAFRFLSCGKTVENLPDEPVVYLDRSGAVRTLDLATADVTLLPPSPGQQGLLAATATCTDADGRVWTFVRRFRSVACGKFLTISTEITADAHHANGKVPVLHLPFLTLFVDRGSGGHKHQAMLAGVEYLDDEPSSNDKEIRTIEHDRRIPAEYRLSAPLAVFTDTNSWLYAGWDKMNVGVIVPQRPAPAAYATVFDTPDRLFRSGGHLLAFWAPAVGEYRCESELSIYTPQPFHSGTHVLSLRAGAGATVADALAHIQPGSLPPPDDIDTVASLELLARGWLDSSIRSGVTVRHAAANGFRFSRAADAPVLMQYLAATLARQPKSDAALVARLRATAKEMLTGIPVQNIPYSSVSHIHRPAPVLVAGDVPAFLERQHTDLLVRSRQLADGRRVWRHPANAKSDLGETLGADHCNGFTAMELEPLLVSATWSGNEDDIAKALAVLDRFTSLYRGTVPRGAQPWEMPLHTPDIVASARIVRCYTLAYLLRPDPAYLREARYWAFTGLSMVYFQHPPYSFEPGAAPVGRYATCAVMGATQWVAPNWIGRPVQWCGLVYAAALWDLARFDSDFCHGEAFWNMIASGITTSGMRQTHTADEPDKQGLLPDSWNLENQSRYPVPINPGTVQENLAEHIGHPYYSLRAFSNGTLIHVPGDVQVRATEQPAAALRCRIAGWPEAPFKVVLTRLEKPASITFNGKPAEHVYLPARRSIVVTLPAGATGDLDLVF